MKKLSLFLKLVFHGSGLVAGIPGSQKQLKKIPSWLSLNLNSGAAPPPRCLSIVQPTLVFLFLTYHANVRKSAGQNYPFKIRDGTVLPIV